MGGPAAVLASGRGPADALAVVQSLRAKCVPSLKCVADGASDRRTDIPSMITCITQKSIAYARCSQCYVSTNFVSENVHNLPCVNVCLSLVRPRKHQ